MISRVATGGLLLVSLAFILFSRFVRSHCVHLMTFEISVMTISAMLSLIFRDDVGFAPLFMVLLFGNLHCAAFAWHRAITGFLLILLQALVWIFVLHKEYHNFLRTQTLSYVLFYISAILASYMRELAHRRVYFIIHDMLTSSGEAKHYSMMLSSSADNVALKSRPSKRFSLAPRMVASISASASVSASMTVSASSPEPSATLSSPPSLDALSDPALGSSSDVMISPSPIPPLSPPSPIPISPPSTPATPHTPPSPFSSPSPYPESQDSNPIQHSHSQLYANLQTSYDRFLDRISGVLSMCIPTRGDEVMSEIGYHRTVYLYVRRLQGRVTQRFLDAGREKQFQKWHVRDTAVSLRRFLVLNIISIACLTTHDFTSFPFTDSETHILLIIRFAIIMPCIFTSLTVSLLPFMRKWRGAIVTTLEICCSAASLSMGLYAWYVLKPRMGPHAVMAYDLYFGYVVRFVVYCFCGMGLLWMQSTGTAAAILVLMFITTTLLGVPLALSPLIIIVIGFVISFYDEKTRRVEFFLLYYKEEILAYIRAKEQYEVPMTVHANVSLSNLLEDGENK
eukprot:Phypoly_transcript_04967.p1 GENE.Phypoly_transcript_04967~~Phypoly_transcript_04967.p1  ORF type:complete len:567 (+),score=113.79 Phypoly_transcript_04967:280-1980(+)